MNDPSFSAKLQSKLGDKIVARLAADVFQYANDRAKRENTCTFDILISCLWMTYYGSDSSQNKSDGKGSNFNNGRVNTKTSECSNQEVNKSLDVAKDKHTGQVLNSVNLSKSSAHEKSKGETDEFTLLKSDYAIAKDSNKDHIATVSADKPENTCNDVQNVCESNNNDDDDVCMVEDASEDSNIGLQITNVTGGLNEASDIVKHKETNENIMKTEIETELPGGLIIEINSDNEDDDKDEETGGELDNAEVQNMESGPTENVQNIYTHSMEQTSMPSMQDSNEIVKPIMIMSNVHNSQNPDSATYGPDVSSMATTSTHAPVHSVKTENIPSSSLQSIMPQNQGHVIDPSQLKNISSLSQTLNTPTSFQNQGWIQPSYIECQFIHPTFSNLSTDFVVSLTREARSKFVIGNRLDFNAFESVLMQILQVYPVFNEKLNDLVIQLLGNQYFYSMYRTWRDQNRGNEAPLSWTVNEGHNVMRMHSGSSSGVVPMGNGPVQYYTNQPHVTPSTVVRLKSSQQKKNSSPSQKSKTDYNAFNKHHRAKGQAARDSLERRGRGRPRKHPLTHESPSKVKPESVAKADMKPSTSNFGIQIRYDPWGDFKTRNKKKRKKRDPAVPPRNLNPNSLKNLKQFRNKSSVELIAAQKKAQILALSLRRQQKQHAIKQAIRHTTCSKKKERKRIPIKKAKKVVPSESSASKLENESPEKPSLDSKSAKKSSLDSKSPKTPSVHSKSPKKASLDSESPMKPSLDSKSTKKPLGYKQMIELQRQAADMINVGSSERGAKVKAQKKLNVYNKLSEKEGEDEKS